MTAKQRQEVDRRRNVDKRIWAHYDHARKKHPYFCDMITCLSDCGANTHLSIYQATLLAEQKADAVEADTLLSCKFFEAMLAYKRGNTANAVRKLYAAIAVLLRTVDVLEGRQKLGKPETKGEAK